MPRGNPIQVVGRVLEVLSPAKLRVELPNGHVVLGHFSEKMHLADNPILPGVEVLLEMNLYDLTQALVTSRQQ